jgi:hypothetical protein
MTHFTGSQSARLQPEISDYRPKTRNLPLTTTALPDGASRVDEELARVTEQAVLTDAGHYLLVRPGN